MAHPSGEEIRGPAAAGSGRPAVRTVLVVDDCPDMAEDCARLLRLWGHDARVAHDGAEALREARGRRPEFVLLDVRLPDMDGYEVARRLRTQAGLEEVTIVMVTGYDSEDDRRRGREAGCDFYLVKPMDLEALEALLSGPLIAAEAPEPQGARA